MRIIIKLEENKFTEKGLEILKLARVDPNNLIIKYSIAKLNRITGLWMSLKRISHSMMRLQRFIIIIIE